MRATDLKLWSQSPLVANANQFSFLFAAELQAEGGTKSKKWGGLYDLGFSVGYNTDTKSVVFQIFRNRETFESTLMPGVAVGGVVVKVGPQISRVSSDSELHLLEKAFIRHLYPAFNQPQKNHLRLAFPLA